MYVIERLYCGSMLNVLFFNNTGQAMYSLISGLSFDFSRSWPANQINSVATDRVNL